MDHAAERNTYLFVFKVLTALLVVTVLAAQVNLGPLNVPIALAIAIAKSLLIAAHFMHLNHGSHLTRLTAAAGFFWLLLLIVITAGDYLTR